MTAFTFDHAHLSVYLDVSSMWNLFWISRAGSDFPPSGLSEHFSFYLTPCWLYCFPTRMKAYQVLLATILLLPGTMPKSESESGSVVSDSLQPPWPYSPWNSPDQNTGVGRLSLLQGIFPTQQSNRSLPYCTGILYQLSHKGSPRIQEWVAYAFSSGFSWPRNQTGVSCIAGGFFTNWAILK